MVDDVTQVVIGGGGVAGLEAALALRDLAGARVDIHLLEPRPAFVDRPMTVLEPFGARRAGRFRLDEILAGQQIHHSADAVTWVDRVHREVHTLSGRTLAYDALLLCPGAVAESALANAVTVSGAPQDAALARMVADLDRGAIQRIAFVVPAPGSWQLPLYELALLTAVRARARNLDVSVTVFIPERLPVEAFGNQAGCAVRDLLAEAGIGIVSEVVCQVPDARSLLVDRAEPRGWPRQRLARRQRPLRFDRILALPRLRGPRLRGVPVVSDGFIPVDVHGRILGAQAEFAAGDATDCPVKHGSVAAQQADAAVATVAALAGADVRPAPFHPVVHGVLVTGGDPQLLRASLVDGHSLRSEIADAGAGSAAPDKLHARYLSPQLARLRDASAAADPYRPLQIDAAAANFG